MPEEKDRHIHNMMKDPDRWVTGDDPATDAQKEFIQTLAEDPSKGIDLDQIDFASITKKEAGRIISDAQGQRTPAEDASGKAARAMGTTDLSEYPGISEGVRSGEEGDEPF